MEQELLLSSLGSFNENLRNVYWNRYSSDFLSFYPDLIVSENRKDLAGELYDKSALFAKGLMLSASTEMRRYILDSKDPMAIEQLNELETTRSKIDELKTKGQDTKSLEDKADKIESDLMAFLKEKNIDILQDLRLSWQDVKAKLKDDDIAIEFLTFDDPGVETPYYVALTLRNTYDLPHIIRLGSERDLLKYTKDAYTSLEASAFIWGRFLFNSELEDVNNIYFSPSGELHKIAIESMPYWMDENMTVSDVYNIYRLSSTRELVTKHKKTTQGNGAVLYGHIDYDNAATSKRESEISRKKHETNAMLEDRTRGGFDPEEAGFRGDEKWPPLDGTHLEVENVRNILKKNVDMRTGVSATETTFKNLSGEKKKIIHIATHGFYWTEEKAQKKNVSFSPRLEDDDNNTVDNAMTRSGLLFSGANLTFDHKPIPNEGDDGVLTAQEVSHLDLRGLDLLVLSACQSGQGEISGDGVFGLQRGFKMAGAQSIIMSLWSVNDKATQIMMTEFYKAYTSGKSKREAFLIAQQKVKEIYGNYKDEEQEILIDKPHWAAFILLDALD
jgi:CHAT domain-containing protein